MAKTATESSEPRGIEVPDNVLVECPLAGRKLRKATVCLKCEHFATLHERFSDEAVPFAKRFMIGCRFPTGRPLFEAE